MRPVLIAGAGPVGLVAAARLVQQGIPVVVLEAGPVTSDEMRASAFHAPKLDMLHRLGAAEPMIAQGIIGPRVQYRARDQGLIAAFDFDLLGDVTRHRTGWGRGPDRLPGAAARPARGTELCLGRGGVIEAPGRGAAAVALRAVGRTRALSRRPWAIRPPSSPKPAAGRCG